jgi:hypothetical protein
LADLEWERCHDWAVWPVSEMSVSGA